MYSSQGSTGNLLFLSPMRISHDYNELDPWPGMMLQQTPLMYIYLFELGRDPMFTLLNNQVKVLIFFIAICTLEVLENEFVLNWRSELILRFFVMKTVC